MKNMLRLAFSRDDALAGELDAELSQMNTKPLSLLDKAINATSHVLDRLRGSEMRLETEIAEREEELRQARLIIKAQSAAQAILEAGTLEAAE